MAKRKKTKKKRVQKQDPKRATAFRLALRPNACAERPTKPDSGSAAAHGPTLEPPPSLNLDYPPQTPDALHHWLFTHLHLHIPRVAIIPNHAAPFDYLCHAFFEPPEVAPRSISLPVLSSVPTAKAAQVVASFGDRDVVLWANRGGGKTFLGALATLLDLIFKPGIEIRILGGSRDQSLRVYAHLRYLLSPRLNPLLADLVDGRITREGLRLINGSIIEILSQSHTSVRGTRVQKLRCDEVELFKPDIWEAAQFVTKSKQCGGIFVHGTVECLSTMHLPFGLMHSLVEECKAGRRKLFKWGVVDVLEHCPDTYACESTLETGETKRCVLFEECQGRAKTRQPPGGHITIADAVAQKSRVCIAAWESEMLCTRPRRTDAILPEFDPKIHVRTFDFAPEWITHEIGPGIKENRRVAHFFCGMDFGIHAPTVILWVAIDDRGVMWVCDERVESNLAIEDHAQFIRTGNERKCRLEGIQPWPHPEYLAVDPAGEARTITTMSSAIQALRNCGFEVRANRSPVHGGIHILQARLAPANLSPPRLFIHERCKTTIESLIRYRYKPGDIDGTKIEKGKWDHCVDALRYLAWELREHEGVQSGNYY